MPLPPQPWPARTPDNFSFPYSCVDDPQARVVLLLKIAQTINISPKVVLNVGAGYDVTPSIAFPEARVVHTDIRSERVAFLGEVGFEAYVPQAVPADLKADLALSILGPDESALDGHLAEQAYFISTCAERRHIPKDMALIGLVDYAMRPITEINEIQYHWNNEIDLHLGIYATEAALFEFEHDALTYD